MKSLMSKCSLVPNKHNLILNTSECNFGIFDDSHIWPVGLKVEIHKNLQNPVPVNRNQSSETKSTSMERKTNY